MALIPAASLRLLKLTEMEVDMRAAEDNEPEMSFRRGYQQGVIDIFCAIERCLDPATREVLQAWIEKDVSMWRAKAISDIRPKNNSSGLHRMDTNQVTTLNHKRFKGFKMFSDGHLFL